MYWKHIEVGRGLELGSKGGGKSWEAGVKRVGRRILKVVGTRVEIGKHFATLHNIFQ